MSGTAHVPEGHSWPQANFCLHGLSQGKREQIFNQELSKESRKPLKTLPNRTPPDTSGANNATRMAAYMVGKVPSMAFCILDDYTVVDRLVDTSGYMNDRRSKGDHTGVDI